MLEIDIPNFGAVRLQHLVTDFTGTLSFNGALIPGVKERFLKISEFLEIHVLTSDTFGTALSELKGLPCKVHILEGEYHDLQKEEYVEKLGSSSVIAFGNGNNDRKMLRVARIGVAVTEGEGCAVDILMAGDVHVTSINSGLDLLLNPKRIKATLRY
ncbi:MAG: HAD hydrolase family protein [Nitrospirae bacterium]|nr:HAD hydrolase family protein [Nitrospirota bacterium]